MRQGQRSGYCDLRALYRSRSAAEEKDYYYYGLVGKMGVQTSRFAGATLSFSPLTSPENPSIWNRAVSLPFWLDVSMDVDYVKRRLCFGLRTTEPP